MAVYLLCLLNLGENILERKTDTLMSYEPIIAILLEDYGQTI